MAAFSYYLDSNIFLPNMPPSPTTIMMDDGNFNSNCFSQFYSPQFLEEPVLEQPNHHESSCVDHFKNSKVVSQSDNEPSVGEKQSTGCGDSTVVVDKIGNGEQVTQNVSLRNRKKRTRNMTSLNSAKSKEKKKCNNATKNEKKSTQEPPKGYIHVRARRGQATDSHSLAERVRRKKISERMNMLQCLVPGCEKVTGKALMLDEIINYVQSLQNQVEFLSMKLTYVNHMFHDSGMGLEGLMMKPEREKSEASTTAVVPCLQEKSINQTQASGFVDSTTATFAPSHNYPLLQYSSPSPDLLLHHGQTHIGFSQPQDNGSKLWGMEDQRQKIFNSYSGLDDHMCSFH